MALKFYRPTTQSRRKMSVTDYSVLTAKKPQKPLSKILKRSSGRDNLGHISVRHQGGGSKRKYRQMISLSEKLDQTAKVLTVEYDPNRSAFITLVEFEDKTKSYILAWEKIKVGDKVLAAAKAEAKLGNRMQLKNIPTGSLIFDLEIHPGQGGKLARSAGNSAVLLSRDAGYAQIKMPSGEIRKISEKCFASIGQTSNISHGAVRIGKAGRNRWRGIRPSVRGKSMHPAAHPHGGGEGVNPIGLKYPKTPWGKHARGVRTRNKKKYSNIFIVKRRRK